jgi:hypothetical protein
MQPNSEKPNLIPSEASEYLERRYGIRRKVATFAKLRCVSSDGPIFFKANRQILYPRSGLDQYAAALLSNLRRSTSDRGEATCCLPPVMASKTSPKEQEPQTDRGQSHKSATRSPKAAA